MLLAQPAESQEARPKDGWSAQITPYLWASGLDGTVTPLAGGPAFEVSKSFGDILETLDAGFFLAGFARHDRLVLLGDVSYVATSDTTAAPGVLAPIDRLGGEVRQLSATVAAGWRVADANGVAVDVLGGMRGWRIESEATASAGGVPIAQASDTVRFVDPLIALRARGDLTDRLSFIGYADYGGFGVGSERTWQLVGTFNWQVSDAVYVSGGYRHLAVDYRDGGKVIDVELSGPMVGLTYRF